MDGQCEHLIAYSAVHQTDRRINSQFGPRHTVTKTSDARTDTSNKKATKHANTLLLNSIRPLSTIMCKRRTNDYIGYAMSCSQMRNNGTELSLSDMKMNSNNMDN